MLHDVLDGYYVGIKYLPIILMFTIGETRVSDVTYATALDLNSLTAIRVLAGTKNSRPVGFYSRNSTKSTLNHKHNNPQHYHHGGAVCPSYGVGSMDPPDRTRVTSSEGVGRGSGKSDLTKSLN